MEATIVPHRIVRGWWLVGEPSERGRLGRAACFSYSAECVEGKFAEPSPDIILYHWSEEACALQVCIHRENGRCACAR